MAADDNNIDDILNEFARSLHAQGEANGKASINSRLYADTARKLTEAITEGMGSSFNYDDPNNALRAALIANVHKFSGAKSLLQNREFTKLLLDENGKIKPFNQFLNDIKTKFILYNEHYLNAEYSTAIATGQGVVLWNQYNDDDILEISTAGDDRVRDSHRKLDGLRFKKSSPFWQTHWIPFDWYCRCTIVPSSHSDTSDLSSSKQSAKEVVHKNFRFNAALTKLVFDDSNPYIATVGNKQLDAVRDYGLKPVASIIKDDQLPTYKPLATETDYYAWWSKISNGQKSFSVKDAMETSILFTSSTVKKYEYFKDHILRKKQDERHRYGHLSVDIVTNFDEIWYYSNRWQYIKYYQNEAFVLVVKNENNMQVADTMYKIIPSLLEQKRKGVLIKKFK